MITLAPGVRLCGETLKFGAKGLRLTRDNEVEDVTVLTADAEVAILNDTSLADFGTLDAAGGGSWTSSHGDGAMVALASRHSRKPAALSRGVLPLARSDTRLWSAPSLVRRGAAGPRDQAMPGGSGWRQAFVVHLVVLWPQ